MDEYESTPNFGMDKSFVIRTKGLTEPTIGIQSGLCHGWRLACTASQQRSLTTLLRHFVSMSINPASTLSSCILRLAELSAVPPRPPPPHCPDHLFNAGWAGTAGKQGGPVQECSRCRHCRSVWGGGVALHTESL